MDVLDLLIIKQKMYEDIVKATNSYRVSTIPFKSIFNTETLDELTKKTKGEE